uniref:Uncharacterized protein n=1 Tax=Salix viminalis TaxID=40686 RepID=A0A6N2LWQ7_SALVM
MKEVMKSRSKDLVELFESGAGVLVCTTTLAWGEIYLLTLLSLSFFLLPNSVYPGSYFTYKTSRFETASCIFTLEQHV